MLVPRLPERLRGPFGRAALRVRIRVGDLLLVVVVRVEVRVREPTAAASSSTAAPPAGISARTGRGVRIALDGCYEGVEEAFRAEQMPAAGQLATSSSDNLGGCWDKDVPESHDWVFEGAEADGTT